jgi:glycosyltransferase involved in cell wall biosynthesis
MIERPFLFDVTRMIAALWSGAARTGIDRVCHAYLHHFGARAQAVVQHRGMFRILRKRHSDELFAMLRSSERTSRAQFARYAVKAWTQGRSRADANGAVYLNVSHTDIDLPAHVRWVRACGLRPIYFIHDLIPITHPQYCRDRAVTRHRGRVTNALASANGIVVNSKCTADHLTAFAQAQGLALPPLIVAPLGVDHSGKVMKPLPVKHPYFVCLGTIEGRKNHRLLLQVWLRLILQGGANAPRLVIIGQWGAMSEAVAAMFKRHPALHDHVTLITRCNDHQARDWIAGAEALLMPSLAEGFGLPVPEALAMGTPVIASDLPCFRENGQGIACLLDPTDTVAWTQVISRFARAGGEKQRQLSLLGSYRPPLWSHHFAAVDDWLATLPEAADGLAPDAESRTQSLPRGPSRSIEA